MVSLNVRQSANEVQDVLAERDVRGLGVIALSASGGVIVAQEITDRLLPMVNIPREPTSATGFAASAGIKGALALGVGFLSTSLSGLPLVVTAWAAIGHLIGAGADLFNAVQRTGFLAEAPGVSNRQSASLTVASPQGASAGGSGNASGPSHSRANSPSEAAGYLG